MKDGTDKLAKQIRPKEIPRYNQQAQMDDDDLSVFSRVKWSPPLTLFRYL
jgi:hypothetical protein